MHGIHWMKSASFQNFGQALRLIGEFNGLAGKCQDGLHLVTTLIARDTPHFVLEGLGIYQRDLAGLNSRQDSQDGFRFDPYPWLCLVVQGALQAATIEVDFHPRAALIELKAVA